MLDIPSSIQHKAGLSLQSERIRNSLTLPPLLREGESSLVLDTGESVQHCPFQKGVASAGLIPKGVILEA